MAEIKGVPRRRVILESPYGGDVLANVAYAKRCLADTLLRGEAPIASHLLFPGVLDDNVPDQRKLGIEAGHLWIPVAELMVVYVDRGISKGMQEGIDRALAFGIPIEPRQLLGR